MRAHRALGAEPHSPRERESPEAENDAAPSQSDCLLWIHSKKTDLLQVNQLSVILAGWCGQGFTISHHNTKAKGGTRATPEVEQYNTQTASFKPSGKQKQKKNHTYNSDNTQI